MSNLRGFRARLYFMIGIQVITAFASIFLIQRMSPAINLILSENVYSLEASESMLALVAQPAPLTPAQEEKFVQSLDRLKRNVTEPGEKPLLDEMTRIMGPGFKLTPDVKSALLGTLLQISEINRNAIIRSDEHSRRLGIAGCWAIVLLGIMGMIFGLAVMNSISTRLLEPIAEITNVMTQWKRGERQRRCTPRSDQGELEGTMNSINDLIDRANIKQGL